MGLPTRSRTNIRQDILKLLDPTAYPIASTVTALSNLTTELRDSVLSPVGQVEDLVSKWVYVSTQPAKVDSTSNISDAGGISASDTTVGVTDGTDFNVGDGIQIENEIMLVTAIVTNDLTVTRAIQGTTAATHADTTDVYKIGPAVGEIANITNVDFSVAAVAVTITPALSCQMVVGQAYEIHRSFHPSIIHTHLDTVMGSLRQNYLIPLSQVTDGHMQDSGVTIWTASVATLTKDTTAASVRHGKQSLKILATAANGQAQSASIPVKGGDAVLVIAEVYITGGDSARLRVYDVTNSAYITDADATSAQTGWVTLAFQYQVPATCELARVDLESPANTDATFWSYVIHWPVSNQFFDIPNLLEYAHDVKNVYELPLGNGLSGTGDLNAYRVNEAPPVFFDHVNSERDDTGVVAARYTFTKRPRNGLWIKARKNVPLVTGATAVLKDADTTAAHKDVLVYLTTASLIEDLALAARRAEKEGLAAALDSKAANLRVAIFPIAQTMMPTKTTIRGNFR